MTLYINAVRLVPSANSTHYHIGYVRLSDGQAISRADVIYNILHRGHTFVTSAPGVPQARVIVDDCPTCGAGDYITTEPDYTTENNLLKLPRF